MSFISPNHNCRACWRSGIGTTKALGPTAEPDLDPKEDAAGPISRGPTSQLGCSRNVEVGGGKGQPPRPSDSHLTSLDRTHLRTIQQQPEQGKHCAESSLQARPAQRTDLGYWMSASKMAPKRQVRLSSHFYQ